MSEDELQITTADMLEIVANSDNVYEYPDMRCLIEEAAKELRKKDEEISNLRETESELREEKEAAANLRVDLAAVTAQRDNLQILHDEAYIAGMKHGWTCCAAGNEERYKNSIESTREQIRRARALLDGDN